jgi:DegV family protein with EDD domain
MAKINVVIDSGVSIPEELLKEYEIEVVPLVAVFGDKLYRDRIDLKTPSQLFDLIDKSDKFPTTSAPAPTAYLEAYRRLSQKVDNIVHVAMSSKLSVSFNSATMAKEMAENELPDVNIEVFDSMTTVGAAGFIALAAARAGARARIWPRWLKQPKR